MHTLILYHSFHPLWLGSFCSPFCKGALNIPIHKPTRQGSTCLEGTLEVDFWLYLNKQMLFETTWQSVFNLSINSVFSPAGLFLGSCTEEARSALAQCITRRGSTVACRMGISPLLLMVRTGTSVPAEYNMWLFSGNYLGPLKRVLLINNA